MFAMGWERVFTSIASERFERRCSLRLLVELSDVGESERVKWIRSLAEKTGLWLSDAILWDGFVAPDGGASCLDAASDEQLCQLLDAATDVADGRHLGQLPHPSRKVFLDALEDVVGAGVAVDDVASALFLARPESFLPLCRPIRTFLTSVDGLGIDEADLPRSARDYLELLMLLTSEMEEGNLPYRDFAEMARAVAEGRTLAQGLAAEDRRRLVETHLRPALRRLFPRDPERVEAEVARLFERAWT